ncbi:MAG: UDP-N-acetylmuramoyl-tripeptide--D-alanyl-D-alanine ligase [Roseburia sp.]|nr:UDP-N-acetylmuramoyl-tripeptide--D-alanyl-D-alanine ligase [Roseburia sp.]MCM1097954.1 UDP-N-acetylmuramoyl-tripeptide--D-alanyl-D-alanine ligase [Ruminococcus flavefaciens]
MDFTLQEIAEACGGRLVLKKGMRGDSAVTSFVIDSRKAEPGGVFLAVKGERVDGHRFISQVYRAGALLAVTEKTPEQVQRETGEDCRDWGSYLLVEDGLRALREIAEAYRRKTGIPVVGITGSVGKTSTKEFIAGVLAEKYRVLKTEGNLNNEIGVPLTLLRIRPETEIAVVEMGISDFGEMHRLSKMARPDVCVITNIGQCHLENLKTRDGILQAKSEIFDFMAEDGQVCLNGGDDKLSGLREIRGGKPHFFGLGENPAEEVSAERIQSRGLLGSEAALRFRGESPLAAIGEQRIHVPLPGEHMVRNAAAAACVAGLFGLSAEEIAAGIEKVKSVSGRANLIPLEKYTLIDDCYNANPVSMKAAIDLLALADTEKVAILGDMFELGEDSEAMHEEVGAYAARAGIDRILCVGERARQIYRGAAASAEGRKQIAWFPDRDTLLATLEQEGEEYLPEGCTVLLKASHGMEFGKVLEVLKRTLH